MEMDGWTGGLGRNGLESREDQMIVVEDEGASEACVA